MLSYPPGREAHLPGVGEVRGWFRRHRASLIRAQAAGLDIETSRALLAADLWGDWGGLLSAVFYIWAPYHSVDVFVRGAMNEAWAFVWFPLIFWSAKKLAENGFDILFSPAVELGLNGCRPAAAVCRNHR